MRGAALEAGRQALAATPRRSRGSGGRVRPAGPMRIEHSLAVARLLLAGFLVAAPLAGGIVPATRAAADDGAYARLLQAHVRPGTINGIRLAAVDYAALKADPLYAAALRDLATSRLDRLADERERFAFWANAYNLLAIKAVLDQYPTRSIRDGGSLLKPIWKKKVGAVAGREYALDDIEHGILRREFKEPRVHFAVVCASLSCPDLRPEPFVAERLDAQLDDQTRAFLANPTKGMVPGPDGKTARVSSIFKWFREDFAEAGGAAAFIRAKAAPAEGSRVAGLTDAGLAYLDYDWSLNDTARAR
jgi:Protein of unknown function, DUF547